MQVTVEKLSPVLVELNVEIDAGRVTTEYEKALKTAIKSSRIKGFRPGKAPQNIVRQVYGPRIDADVIQRLVDESFPKAAAEQSMQPINQPRVEPARLESGKPFSYKARVEVLPGIDSVTYDGLEAQRPSSAASDEQVKAELAAIQRANSTLEAAPAGHAAKSGDVLTVDIRVFVGQQLIEDAGTQGFAIELGSGQVFPEIETALAGAKSGDQLDATVKMPEAHPHPALKGQDARFSLSVSEVKERKLPALDDEFAKDLGDFETLAALEDDVKKQLETAKKEQSDSVLAERLVKALVEANPIPVPPSLVAQQMRVSEQEVLQRARQLGQTAGGVGAELRQRIQEDSELKVRAGLLMAEIAKAEKIQIGNAEIEEGLSELAAQTGKNVAKLRAEYAEPKKRELLVGMILENKVLDIIEAKAKIVDE